MNNCRRAKRKSITQWQCCNFVAFQVLTSRPAMPRRRHCGSVKHSQSFPAGFRQFSMHRAGAAGSVATERRRRQRPFSVYAGVATQPMPSPFSNHSFSRKRAFARRISKASSERSRHVLKHPRTMPGDNVDILQCSATDSKDVVHGSKGSMPNSSSQGYGAAGVQRRNQNLLGVTALLPVIRCARWKLPIGRH